MQLSDHVPLFALRYTVQIKHRFSHISVTVKVHFIPVQRTVKMLILCKPVRFALLLLFLVHFILPVFEVMTHHTSPLTLNFPKHPDISIRIVWRSSNLWYRALRYAFLPRSMYFVRRFLRIIITHHRLICLSNYKNHTSPCTRCSDRSSVNP